SLFSGLPLDIYVWDDPTRAQTMRVDEAPIDLLPTYRAARPAPARRIAFLRGCRTESRMGSTDIEVIPELAALGWQPLLIAGGRRGASPPADVSCPTAVAWVPSIPLLGALVANFTAVAPVLRFRPDVIVVNPGFAVAGAICALLAHRAVVITDVRSIPVEESAGFGRLVHTLEFRLAMHLPRLAGVTAISGGTARVLRERYGLGDGVPSAIWSSGANTRLFNPNVVPAPRETVAPADGIALIYHGHLTMARGLGTLLNALARARQREPDLHLVLLGRGPALDELRRMADEPGLRDAVTFVPPVAIGEVPAILAACDGAVVPLPDHPWWRVSSPMKLFEALAMGLPVLATDIEPHRELADAVRLCRPDEIGLADGLLAIARDVRARRGAARRADLDRLSWGVQARRLDTFLRLLHAG
ncbi:MAG TPA: glycosyltransferase, partial [Candidatus Limnocylindrales bacterium]|nr:glycosyltransferase [Candidatus Limnocylindrales bacterium]